MTKTKKICYLAMLTALYVVLSAFLKVTIIGNIQPDFGYLAFTVALCMFGLSGTVVGVLGCSLESILFSAYGFAPGWAVANLIIGLGCGVVFSKYKSLWIRTIAIVLFCLIGLLGAKTAIECVMYQIPLVVKLPKNMVAFGMDAIMMIFGLGLNRLVNSD